jgi:hypothetical protein
VLDEQLRKALHKVAAFYDRRKIGNVGSLGFRRSSDLSKLLACLGGLIDQNILVPKKSLFLDMGCADGRVNVLLSYLAKISVGVELDEWTLDEYEPLRTALEGILKADQLGLPPANIFLYRGNSLDDEIHETIHRETGVSFGEFDLFYTYLTMQEKFAELVAKKAKPGAVFMVYGLEKILPRFEGLRLLTPEKPVESILALYQKM